MTTTKIYLLSFFNLFYTILNLTSLCFLLLDASFGGTFRVLDHIFYQYFSFFFTSYTSLVTNTTKFGIYKQSPNNNFPKMAGAV